MVIETLHAADADASGERPQIGLVIKNLVPGGLFPTPSLPPSLRLSLPSPLLFRTVLCDTPSFACLEMTRFQVRQPGLPDIEVNRIHL
jgi:hypothetical protein